MLLCFPDHGFQGGDSMSSSSNPPDVSPLLDPLFHSFLSWKLLERSKERLFILLEAPEESTMTLE